MPCIKDETSGGAYPFTPQFFDAGNFMMHYVDEVVIDGSLFVPFPFREEFDIRPILMNDDVVDLIINPTSPDMHALVDWRPKSAALGVDYELVTRGAGMDYTP